MIWREPIDHVSDCYFCLTEVKNTSRFGKNTVVHYPEVPSVSFPILHSDILAVSVYLEIDDSGDHFFDVKSNSHTYDKTDDKDCYYDPGQDKENNSSNSSCQHELFNQEEVNDLARDLGLLKELSTKVCYFRNRANEF